MLEIILVMLGPAWMRSRGFPAAQRSRWQSKVYINRIYKVYNYYVSYLALSANLVQKYLMNYWIDLHAIRSTVMFPEGNFNEFSLALRDWYFFHLSEVKKLFLLPPVPVYVSKPEISFSVHKEGTGYHGNVTCWSTRGSPPVNFYLLLDGKEVDSATAAQTLAAWFLVVVVPELDMGEARCRVKTENQDLTSEPVNLEVGMKMCEWSLSLP